MLSDKFANLRCRLLALLLLLISTPAVSAASITDETRVAFTASPDHNVSDVTTGVALVADAVAQASCTVTISPTSSNLPSAIAASGFIAVTAGTGCNWTATSNDAWITIGVGASGTGNGTVTYNVTQNTSTTPRTGTLTIGGNTFTITQPGAPCTFTILPSSVLLSTSVATTGTVTVTDDQTDPSKTESTVPGIITTATLRDAPLIDQKFQDALPLLPGVVRGPDGTLNIKGTRPTQSGILVSSLNVTDPVTGSPAIELPLQRSTGGPACSSRKHILIPRDDDEEAKDPDEGLHGVARTKAGVIVTCAPPRAEDRTR